MIGTKETAAALAIVGLLLAGCAHGSGEGRHSNENAKHSSRHKGEKSAVGEREEEEEDEEEEEGEEEEKDEEGEKDGMGEEGEEDEEGEEGEEGEECCGSEQMMETFEDLVEVFQALGKDLLSASSALEKAMAGRSGRPVEISLEIMEREGQAPVIAWQVEFLDGEDLQEVSLDARSGSVLQTGKSDEKADEVRSLAKALAGARKGLADCLREAGESLPGMVIAASLGDEDGESGWRVIALHGKDIAIEVMDGGKKAMAGSKERRKAREEKEEDEGDEEDERPGKK